MPDFKGIQSEYGLTFAAQLPIKYLQLPFKTPKIPSNGDHKALNRGTLGV